MSKEQASIKVPAPRELGCVKWYMCLAWSSVTPVASAELPSAELGFRTHTFDREHLFQDYFHEQYMYIIIIH